MQNYAVYNDSEDLLGSWFKRNPGKRENIFLVLSPGISRF